MALISVAARTHVGLVRRENEDAVLIGGWVSAGDGSLEVIRELSPQDRPYVVAVLDGLGGHAGGGVASRIAAVSLGSESWESISAAAVTEQVQTAARRVHAVSDAMVELRGLGTTVAGVAVTATGFSAFNVGDSSVFRAGGGFLGMLSVPDRRADLDNEGASLLTQSLSIYTAVARPHVEVFPIAGPVRLILCSDGLTDVVSESDIRALAAPRSGGEMSMRGAERLLQAALDGGAPDNVSVVVVDLTPDEETSASSPEAVDR